MLIIKAEKINICRITKLLLKEKLKASITRTKIELEGNLSNQLLRELIEILDISKISSIQNYTQHFKSEVIHIEQHESRYSDVKKGEVYWVDFNPVSGWEIGKERLAIVVQGDFFNSHSDTTIVIPCTSQSRKKFPDNYTFEISEKTMADLRDLHISKQNTALASQIRAVDKARLKRYVGTLKPEVMEEIQKIIEKSLQITHTQKSSQSGDSLQEKLSIKKIPQSEVSLQRESTKEQSPSEKPVEVLKTYPSEEDGEEENAYRNLKGSEKSGFNLTLRQLQMLSKANLGVFLEMTSSKTSNIDLKVKNILSLFGFNLDAKGVQYLFSAIVIALEKKEFNLEELAEEISEKQTIGKDEIKRLIVARVKENFGMRKSPATEFIRMICSFLDNKEDDYSESYNKH